MNTSVTQHPHAIPLSSSQLDIWSDQMLHPGSPLYNIGGYMRIEGQIDPALFEQAVRHLARKHDALRTVLVPGRDVDDVPMQTFAPDVKVTVPLIDLSRDPSPLQASLDWMRAAFAKPFSLAGETLFRYALLKLGHDSFHAFVCYHHLIADGWTVALLARSVASAYSALKAGDPIDMSAPSYATFVENDRAYLSSPAFGTQSQYWLKKFSPPPEPLLVPRHAAGFTVAERPGRCSTHMLSRERYDRISTWARSHGGSTFHAILAALYVYFARTARRDEVVVGLPVLNRANAAFKETAGLFVTVTAARLGFGLESGFGELIGSIGRALKQDYRHQRFPLSQINRETGSVRRERDQLFDICLSFERHDYEAAFGDARGVAIPIANEYLHHPLMLYVREFHDDEPVQFDFVYHTAYFTADDIEALQKRLFHVLDHAMQAPDAPVYSLSLLSPEEAGLIATWNANRRDYPDGGRLLDLYDAAARRYADRTAVVVDGARISYRELDARANRLARYLQSVHRVGPETLVGLCMERSVETIVAILGTLKAGAGYLPLDPSYPQERLQRMLDDARPAVLLSQQRVASRLVSVSAPTVFLDTDRDMIAMHDADVIEDTASAGNVAYVIYTSGSTGHPKGVAVTRGNLLASMRSRFAFYSDPVERFLMTWSCAFDGSITGIFWTLFSGGTLCLAAEQEYNDATAVVKLIERHAITHLLSLPAFHALLLDEAESWQLASLSTVIVAGEACGADLVKRHAAMLPQAALFNEYGPTEGCVWSTVQRCRPETESGPIPIGKPIENVQIHLLDEQLEPVPVGVPAEIYIGGVGVARGYLHDPGITAEKFLPCRFSGQPGARMYKTGDLARWRPDGSVEFLGRTDHQVKVRGFRIELNDIEAGLLGQPEVRDAVVLLREDRPGDHRLVAYVVLHAHFIDTLMSRRCDVNGADEAFRRQPLQDIAIAEATRLLKNALGRTLPVHMVPHHFIFVDDMPRTPNGKADRKALPAPRMERTGAYFTAPCTPVEVTLAGIWSELLQVERVGRHDNFFDLGGHSLLAVSMVQRMRKCGLHAEVRSLFTAPTLAELAAATRQIADTTVTPPNRIPAPCSAIRPDMLTLVALSQAEIDRVAAAIPGGASNIQDIYPLGPQQEGLLLHRLSVADGDAFLLRALFGAESRAHIDAFLGALQEVVARHDALRTAVFWEGLAEPVQIVLRDAAPIVELVTLDGEGDDVAAQLMARFDTRHFRMDVRQAPLLRIAIAHDAANDRWLMLLLGHHLILDHTSLDVLAAELRVHMAGQERELTAPPQYRGYIAHTRSAARLREHEEFFRNMLGEVNEPTLPFGLQDVMVNGGGITESRRMVDSGVSSLLRRKARDLGVSTASLCHLAWALVLARTTGRDDIVFGTVLFGRLHGEAVDRTMGLFVNTLPLRVRLSERPVGEVAMEVHTLLAGLLQHEHAPLSLARRCSAVPASVPLFSALLNYRYSDVEASSPGASVWPGITLLSGDERTNYPFFLSIDDYGTALELTAQTSDAVEPSRVCGFMHMALENLVRALGEAPATACHDIDVLPPDEYALLRTFGNVAAEPPQTASVQQLFEEQVLRTPHQIALADEESSIVYEELNAKANRLAHYLIAAGIGPDRLVGVCMERSAEMIVVLLAILKAGGAYVPLDSDYPRDRLATMLEDAAPDLVLSSRSACGHLPGGTPIVRLEEIAPLLERYPAVNPRSAVLSENLAYVLYTSGSTGRPKGVMVQRGGLADLCVHQAEQLRAHGCRAVLQFASINFDMSVEEIFPALVCGARLVLRPPSMLAPDSAFLSLIRTHRIDAVNLPTVFWQDWVQRVDAGESAIPDCVKLVAVGGEKVCVAHYRRWARHTVGRDGVLINAYGPTEATVNATQHMLPFDCIEDRPEMPIGRPLHHSRIHILDARLAPVPIGVPGELHIGGNGLARGYLGRPDLTVEKFIPDPFSRSPGARLYKSGDLARFMPDGTIEYLGRIDNQVKIRGFRIELGEIESALSSHPAVSNAVVAVRSGGNTQRIIAYYTRTTPVDAAALRMHVAAVLPNYMMPSAYMALDTMPLLPNGKLNRHALPLPGEDEGGDRIDHRPQGVVEETLAGIWCALLKREHIGRYDDFFALGGHSLLAARMVSRVHEIFHYELPLSALFRAPTIAQLAAAIAVRQSAATLVVPLKAGKADIPPVWLIHPGGGTVFCYRQFAERFPHDRPVYAIQAPEVAGLGTSGTDMDDLCRRYLSEILNVYADGPICLAGWSLGGALAFRMAELLEHDGHAVGWVGIIDTLAQERSRQMAFEEFVLWAFTRTHASVWKDDAALDAARTRLLNAVTQHGEEQLRRRLSTDPSYLRDELGLDTDGVELLRKQYEVMRGHACLMAGFVPGMVNAPLHVFIAQESTHSEHAPINWLSCTRSPDQSTELTLPGDHESVLLTAANVNLIVRVLAEG